MSSRTHGTAAASATSLLVEQQRDSLVRRWYPHVVDSEQRPLAARRRCATPLLPHAPAQPGRAPVRVASYAGTGDCEDLAVSS